MSVLSVQAVARACHDAGFTGERLVTIVAIARAESGLDPSAVGDRDLVDDVWGPSIGLLQIRSLHRDKGTGRTRDELANVEPGHNARAGWEISGHGSTFGPWSTFASGAHRLHVASVRRGCHDVDPTVTLDGTGDRPLLREGDSGPDVEQLQRLLTSAGYPCAADGSFGPLTNQAVRAFQSSRSLDIDGIVGPQTWAALLSGQVPDQLAVSDRA
jgi:hypothetical protein